MGGVLALGGLLPLTQTTPAEAQTPEQPHEQIQIMREMSASLKGIETAVRNRCPVRTPARNTGQVFFMMVSLGDPGPIVRWPGQVSSHRN